MATVTCGATDVGRKRQQELPPDEAIGPILAENLMRLGYVETTVKVTDVARRVAEHTGKSFSRQRISAILNAVRVNPQTVQTIADALGVTVEELTRRPPR